VNHFERSVVLRYSSYIVEVMHIITKALYLCKYPRYLVEIRGFDGWLSGMNIQVEGNRKVLSSTLGMVSFLFFLVRR
jgi:hypothetical protein